MDHETLPPDEVLSMLSAENAELHAALERACEYTARLQRTIHGLMMALEYTEEHGSRPRWCGW